MEDNRELSIKIILYLLLALAFFSKYSFLRGSQIYTNGLILQIFFLGILALVFLFLSPHGSWLKIISYYFSGYFILVFLFFLLDNWCVTYLEDRFISSWHKIIPILLGSKVIFSIMLISVAITLFLVIIILFRKVIKIVRR